MRTDRRRVRYDGADNFFIIMRSCLKIRFVPLQAMTVCVEVGLLVHALTVFLLAPTALIWRKEYPVPNE